jgi:membrane-bound inhibitor of C-type lysozyme
MKKINSICLTLIVYMLFITSCSNDVFKVNLVSMVEYKTETNEIIKATYYKLDANEIYFVKVELPDNSIIVLPNNVSASGVRYTDDREYVWWEKGTQAILEKRDSNGIFQVIYSNCIEITKIDKLHESAIVIGIINTIKSIISSIQFWTITFPLFIAICVWFLNERSKRKWEKWKIKKQACMNALELANAILSNYKYENLKEDAITPQYISIETARSCFNELACTCSNNLVIEKLKHIMFDQVKPDAIVDLRNAVRKELGFSKNEIDTDREKAFIGKINCEKK